MFNVLEFGRPLTYEQHEQYNRPEPQHDGKEHDENRDWCESARQDRCRVLDGVGRRHACHKEEDDCMIVCRFGVSSSETVISVPTAVGRSVLNHRWN